MALTLTEQYHKAIDASSNVLIAFKQHHDADSIASALALKLLLEKMGKKVSIASDNFTLDAMYSFLPESQCISNTLEDTKQLKICIDVKQTPIKDLSYAIEDGTLNIIITPKKGALAHEHLTTQEGTYPYDLIITVDTEDLESLGSLFTDHQDLFYNTTIINIDHKPENEEYGQINHVDPNTTSTAEALYHLISSIDQHNQLMDAHIAQCLLCGIIAKTKSFKSVRVTPKTLHTASQLINHGADRDKIIKNLYYTKSIKTLKLWGKVLTRLTADAQHAIAWSYITQKDFDELKVSPDKLTDVIEELILTAPEAKIILIVYEYKQQLHATLYSDTTLSSKELAAAYDPFGSKRLATFKVLGDNAEVAARLLVNDLKLKLSQKK